MAANIVFSAEANSFKEKNPIFYHFSTNLLSPDVITSFIQKTFLFPEFWNLIFKTRYSSLETQQFFESITIDSLNQRMADGMQRGDYVDHLLTVMRKRNRQPVEMAGDAINFYIDTFETSSVFMTYVLYFVSVLLPLTTLFTTCFTFVDCEISRSSTNSKRWNITSGRALRWWTMDVW